MQTTMSSLTRRYVVAASLAVLALLVLAMPTLAGVSWCRADPIVKLGGAEYQVLVAVPAQNVPQVNGALDFTFISPDGRPQTLLFTDSGFNGHGETVTFAYDSSMSQGARDRMRLDVKHIGGVFPVQVEVFKNGKLQAVVNGTSDVIEMTLP